MAAYQGTYFEKYFTFKDTATGALLNITGWTFEMMIKVSVDDTAPLATLTTAGGGLVVADGPNGRAKMAFNVPANFQLGKVVFDVLRTDASPGPVWVFGGSFKVKKPATVVGP